MGSWRDATSGLKTYRYGIAGAVLALVLALLVGPLGVVVLLGAGLVQVVGLWQFVSHAPVRSGLGARLAGVAALAGTSIFLLTQSVERSWMGSYVNHQTAAMATLCSAGAAVLVQLFWMHAAVSANALHAADRFRAPIALVGVGGGLAVMAQFAEAPLWARLGLALCLGLPHLALYWVALGNLQATLARADFSDEE